MDISSGERWQSKYEKQVTQIFNVRYQEKCQRPGCHHSQDSVSRHHGAVMWLQHRTGRSPVNVPRANDFLHDYGKLLLEQLENISFISHKIKDDSIKQTHLEHFTRQTRKF